MSAPSSYHLPPVPTVQRRSSSMAGNFEPGSDIRDEISQTEGTHRPADQDVENDSDSLLPIHVDQPSSLMDDHMRLGNNTALEEEEMHKRLADVESSFVPEPSHVTDETHATADRSSQSIPAPTTPPPRHDASKPVARALGERIEEEPIHKPQTVGTNANTSALEQMSSSPTAARTVSRVQSLASLGGYETAAERDEVESPTRRKRPRSTDPDATPRKGEATLPGTERQRPQYLSKRSSHARLSYDSMASSATETSDMTLGADFALQTGGALSDSHKLRRKPNLTLSRSTSLGSLASGVSNASDDEAVGPKRSAAVPAPELSTLAEESPLAHRTTRIGHVSPNHNLTPRASINSLTMPTDSVIANHVRDIAVPETIARKFRDDRSRSPDKNYSMATMTPGPKRGLTLKEHRSTVEKLGKENFDLKMKIHFLDQALQRRSEDGVKEMITENVQLKSDRLRLEKDNHGLRKQIRELQRKLDEATGKKDHEDQGYGTDEERSPTAEEEVIYLRERVEITEIELEKLRQENIVKESEKRRLAEMVRNMGESRPGASEVGSREERDMWKDMLEAETIAREQAEDDTRRLREEIARLRQENLATAPRSSSKLRVIGGQVVSRPSSAAGSVSRTVAENAELSRLRHECSELQKTIGAQASALTSRNKEKEMLYQEIENLKLGRMGGVRSVAGDSILDRSASRARSNSRASNGTKLTRLSENEREDLETRIDQLRDELSQAKLEKQNLQTQFDEALVELDAVDQQAQADADQFNEEMTLLAQERDNAVRDADEQEQAFQQLKIEAQDEIDGLGDELDAKIDEFNKLQDDFKAQKEDFIALQSEMRSAAEGLVRLEQDSQQNNARYQKVRAELEGVVRQLESHKNSHQEAEAKCERLTVQQESSRNEIVFLREEQDADKIKISDLESLLKKTHLNLDAERDRARELERRLSDAQQQHEMIVNQDKQDTQRMVNDLSREISAAKDELRRVRKTLSTRDLEVASVQERIHHMEEPLRRIVNDPTATSANLIAQVSKMHRDLEQTSVDLETTRNRLDEHRRLLANRDALLEETATENKRLVEMLDKERHDRRQDVHSFEQARKSHEATSRIINVNNTRIAELEADKQGYRRQFAQNEIQYKEQLAERNQILLTIWRKMAAMCGQDWAYNHALINGNLPSQEVIGNTLFWPVFSRNLLMAAKQVEGVIAGFKDKIKQVERDLTRDYKALEREFEIRSKKLERIEESWEKWKLREREVEAGLLPQGTARSSRNSEITKLKNEIKVLRTEIDLYQHHQHGHHSHDRSHNRFSSYQADTDETSTNGLTTVPTRGSSARRSRKGRSTPDDRPASIYSAHSSNTGNVDNTGRSANMSANRDAFGMNQLNSGSTLVVPPSPMHAPVNGNFAMPPISSAVATTTSTDVGTHPKVPRPNPDVFERRMVEMERRLKAEREGRLTDRAGMRSRLQQRDEENEELKRQLARERSGREWKQMYASHDRAASAASMSGLSSGDGRLAEASASAVSGLDYIVPENDGIRDAAPPSFSRRKRASDDDYNRAASISRLNAIHGTEFILSPRPGSRPAPISPSATSTTSQPRQDPFQIERDDNTTRSNSPGKRIVREIIASPSNSRSNSVKTRPGFTRHESGGSRSSHQNNTAGVGLREVVRTASAMSGLV